MLNSEYFKQIELVLKPIRQQNLELARMAELCKLASSPGFVGLIQANQRWQDLFSQATASSTIFGNIDRTHHTWSDITKSFQDSSAGLQAAVKLYPSLVGNAGFREAARMFQVQDSFARLQAAAQLSLGNTTQRLAVTESLFARLDFEALRQAVALPAAAFLKLENTVNDVMLTYGKLADSIRSPSDMTNFPEFTVPGATREVFTIGYALEAIQTSGEQEMEMDSSEVQLIAEVEQESSGCLSLLLAVEPSLVGPYEGAHDALGSQNPDRARHILSSLRELWSHLLRRLAPDEQVLAWVPSNDKELLHNGGPTRRARILYICRDYNHAPLSEFVIKDSDTLVDLINLFNRVHELELQLSDRQLRALLLKSDSWLMYILQIRDGSK